MSAERVRPTIAEIVERWGSATPGPWEDYAVYAYGHEAADAQYGVQTPGEHGRGVAVVGDLGDRDHAPNDAHAIANAPTDVMFLLDEVNRLTAERDYEFRRAESIRDSLKASLRDAGAQIDRQGDEITRLQVQIAQAGGE